MENMITETLECKTNPYIKEDQNCVDFKLKYEIDKETINVFLQASPRYQNTFYSFYVGEFPREILRYNILYDTTGNDPRIDKLKLEINDLINFTMILDANKFQRTFEKSPIRSKFTNFNYDEYIKKNWRDERFVKIIDMQLITDMFDQDSAYYLTPVSYENKIHNLKNDGLMGCYDLMIIPIIEKDNKEYISIGMIGHGFPIYGTGNLIPMHNLTNKKLNRHIRRMIKEWIKKWPKMCKNEYKKY